MKNAALIHLPQIAVAGSPLLAKKLAISPIIWPPLGSLETFALSAATVLIGLGAFLPRAIKSKQQARSWLWKCIVGALVFFLAYACLVGQCVLTEYTPHNGSQSRSVGFMVEPSIRAQFPDKNDDELLMLGGLEDWQIKKVWTPGSVLIARLCILLSYVVTLGLVNVALGAAAHISQER